MIVTMNLNPSIIRTTTVANLLVDELNYIDEHTVSFVDSPVHVGHIVKIMQGEVLALGFTGGTGGRHMKAYLNSDKVYTDLTWLEQEIQTKFQIVNNSTGETITMVDKGIEVDNILIKNLKQKLKASITDATVMLFAGSIPINMPKDSIKEILEIISAKDKKYILALKTGYILELLEYRPYCVVLDTEDLKLLDITTDNFDEAIQQIHELMQKKHIHYVFINRGLNGLVSLSKNKICEVTYEYMLDVSWKVSVKDAMLGMLAICFERGYEQEKLTRLVYGTAIATMKTEKPYLCSRKDIDFFQKRVKLSEIMSKSKGFAKVPQK
jgi:1-phosphofructokinase